ncbi:DUF3846 domain-containing protein [Pseudomonas syringae pv. actinidiae]|nr:DUF3846 domain-containing protein [Pseudomonas syringae pv. actinidiae]
MALVIKTDGTITEVVDTTNVNKLEWLQEQVGGYLEQLSLHPPVEFNGKTYHGMMLNEEGKLEQLPANQIASNIATEGGLVNDVIVGNVVLYSEGEID